MPDLKWRARLLNSAASLRSNCKPGDEDFCGWQGKRPEQSKIIQGGPIPDWNVLRCEVGPGDEDQRYSGDRMLLSANANTWVHEGETTAVRFAVRFPVTWVGWGSKSGAFWEMHQDAPASTQPRPIGLGGSAPIYLSADDQGFILTICSMDKAGNVSVRYERLGGFQRGQWSEFLIDPVWNSDPAKGGLAIAINGQKRWSGNFATLFPQCIGVPLWGLYGSNGTTVQYVDHTGMAMGTLEAVLAEYPAISETAPEASAQALAMRDELVAQFGTRFPAIVTQLKAALANVEEAQAMVEAILRKGPP